MMADENNVDVEIESEGYNESKTTHAERKPCSRKRGPDKKPNYFSNIFYQFGF